MRKVPPGLEKQYDRFLEGKGDVAGSLVLRLRERAGKRCVSEAWTALVLSRIYITKGRLALASSFLRLSRDLFLSYSSRGVPTGLWVNRAIILKLQGRLPEAGRLLGRAFDLSLRKDDPFAAAKAAVNLGVVLSRGGGHDEARKFIDYALMTYRSFNNRKGIIRTELAGIFLDAKRSGKDEVVDRVLEILSGYPEKMFTRERLSGFLLVSEIFIENGDFEKAEIFLKKTASYRTLLERFRPHKIRWLCLKSRLEAGMGRKATAVNFGEIARVYMDRLGVIDPESLSLKESVPVHRIMETGLFYRTESREADKTQPRETGKDWILRGKNTVNPLQSEKINKESLTLESTFITRNRRMVALLEEIKQSASVPVPILIEGESGTGKEIVSRLIHKWSGRGKDLFMPVNAAALPSELFESTLFGHARGAFTGAEKKKQGLLEAAGRGSIFLDEIGELATVLQAKLLRFLDSGEYISVGESLIRKSEARIIAATNRDLREAIESGGFRVDLYYRLATMSFRIPPLRERKDDIILLSEYFLEKIFGSYQLGPFVLGNAIQGVLMSYDWPGNVRELKNELISAAIRRGRGVLRVSDLSSHLINCIMESNPEAEKPFLTCNPTAGFPGVLRKRIDQEDNTLKERLRQHEKEEILAALRSAGGNKALAASMLGLKRTTFLYRLKRSGLDRFL